MSMNLMSVFLIKCLKMIKFFTSFAKKDLPLFNLVESRTIFERKKKTNKQIERKQ